MENNSEMYEEIGLKIFAIGPTSLILLGFALNPICFIIYSRKPFSRVPAVFYLKVLSVLDILANIPVIFNSLAFLNLVDVAVLNSGGCKLSTYFAYAPAAAAIWFDAVVAIDRAIAVAVPNKFKFRETRMFQWTVTAAVVLYNYLYYSPILAYYQIYTIIDENDTMIHNNNNYYESGTVMCDTLNNFSNVLNWLDFVSTVALPFICMIVSTVVISKHLGDSRKKLQREPQTTTSISQSSKGPSVVKLKSPNNRREQKDFTFTLTLFSLNVSFILLNIGIGIRGFIASNTSIDSSVYLIIAGITSTLYGMHLSLKLVIYILVNSIFRYEFFRLFRISK